MLTLGIWVEYHLHEPMITQQLSRPVGSYRDLRKAVNWAHDPITIRRTQPAERLILRTVAAGRLRLLSQPGSELG
jgi:hypothetical protein